MAYNIYFPYIPKDHRVNVITFPEIGLQTTYPGKDILQKLKDVGINRSCIGGIGWANYEPEQGEYNESAFSKLKNTILSKNELYYDIKLLVACQGTPEWARDRIDMEAPKREYIKDYIDFVDNVIFSSKSVDGVGIDEIQVYNEIDSTDGMLGAFGCWGIEYIDTYCEILSDMQYIRDDVDLSVGLMLPYDDTKDDKTSYDWCYEFKNRGGDNLVDKITFHHYTYYYPGIDSYAISLYADNLVDKYNKMKEIFPFSKIGVSETNMITRTVLDNIFEYKKAEYVAEAYNRAVNAKIPEIMYYHYYSAWAVDNQLVGAWFVDRYNNELPAWGTLTDIKEMRDNQ